MGFVRQGLLSSSFLLITPNHLSRIRRELAKNPDTSIKK